MSKIVAIFLLILTSQTMASEIQGKITKFSGFTVESHKPYSYIAIQTKDGQRIQLPNWILPSENNNLLKSTVSVDGMVSPILCTDMSSACSTGYLKDIRSFKINFPIVSNIAFSKYSSRLEKFSGRTIETGNPFSYIAINDKIKVAVPNFLNATELLKNNVEMTVEGKANILACTDMSSACSPAEISPLKSVEIKF